MKRALALVVAVIFTACGGGGDGAGVWPDVAIEDVGGAPARSHDVLTDGRPAVVTIWATTCAPCKEEIPRLQQLAAANPALDVAAVNLGDEEEDIVAFMGELGITLPVWVDPQGRLAEELAVPAVPATLFVDADGKIVQRHLGELSAADLQVWAARLLGS